MDKKAFESALITFFLSVGVSIIFLFFASGFIPENCIVSTVDANGNGNCAGIASVFPRGVQGLVLIGIVIYSAILAKREYKKEYKENLMKKKNEEFIEKMRKKNKK